MSQIWPEAAPLLITKLHIPRASRSLVSRPRLTARLNESITRRLTLVAAPAGSGKTTLLSEWAHPPCARLCPPFPEGTQTCGGKDRGLPQPRTGKVLPTAWISLDEGDNDPVRFWAYVIAALERVYAGVGGEAAQLLRSGLPQSGLPRSSPPVPIETVLTALLNAVAVMPGDCMLVLDDYHTITLPSIHHAVAALLDHLPPNMHLVIASRVDPPLPLPRLRARGQLLELRAADLRFTPEEAAAFLNQVMGLALTPEHIAALEMRTEGWVAGLQLAALSMQGRTDIASFIDTFAGSSHYVFDYLVEEVLNLQPESMRAFLLQTSILDRLCGSLCDAVTGMAGNAARDRDSEPSLSLSPRGTTAELSGQAMLEKLEHSNLFVIPLDDEQRWYRYHHLFREFLRSRPQPDGMASLSELHRRAAGWYAQNGFVAEAVPHALAACDWERAAQLIEEVSQSFLMRGETVTLQEWLSALPHEVVYARPRLCVVQGWISILNFQMQTAETCLRRAEQALAAETAATGAWHPAVLGETAVMRGLVAIMQGDIHGAAEFARQALAHLPGDDVALRSVIAMDVGVSHVMNGDAPAASQALAEAAALGQQARHVLVAATALWMMGDQERLQGRLRRAAEVYRQAMRWLLDQDGQPLPIAGIVYNGMGELLREWNQLDEAARYLTQGIELCHRWREPLALDGYVSLARLKQAQGDAAGARDALHKTEQWAHESDMLTMEPVLVASQHVWLWIAQGDLESASRWALECGLSPTGEWSERPYPYVARESVQMALARVLLAQARPEQALGLLQLLLPEADRLGRKGIVIEILTLQALVHQALGDVATALASLEQALTLAEPEAYVRTFVDEGTPMAELLVILAARGIKKDYVNNLLAVFKGETQRVPPSVPASLLSKPLSERELQVLHLIAEGLSNHEIAGRLFVVTGTVKTHINNIYRKMDVRSRTQALARAKELNLL